MLKFITTWVSHLKIWADQRRLKQAIVLKPDYAEAHSNLGYMLKNLERLDEAEASDRTAIEQR